MKSDLCRRCDWTPLIEVGSRPAQVQLAGHAITAGHPLCILCTASLRPDETQTCIRCLGRTRRSLVAIAKLWPDVLAVTPSPVGVRLGDNGGRSAATTVPGGLAAVLRGDGSSGIAGMLAGDDVYEHPAEDGVSLPFQVWRQVVDWCEVKGEPLPTWRRSIAERGLDWLEARLSWAAAEHTAFDEFSREMAGLEAWVRRATGHIEAPIKVEGRCLDCVGRNGKPVQLEREMTDGGFADDPDCPMCHRRYGPADYPLAVAEHLRRAAQVA